MSRARRLLLTGAAVASLAISLSACRDGGLDSAPADKPSSSQSPTGPAGTASGAPAGDPGSASSAVTIAPSVALGSVSADLSGINAGASQADTDLGAGDSARAKPDDPN